MWHNPSEKAKIVLNILIQRGETAVVDTVLASDVYNGVIDGHKEGPGAIADDFMKGGPIYDQLS